jgi:hypothetical protein
MLKLPERGKASAFGIPCSIFDIHSMRMVNPGQSNWLNTNAILYICAYVRCVGAHPESLPKIKDTTLGAWRRIRCRFILDHGAHGYLGDGAYGDKCQQHRYSAYDENNFQTRFHGIASG